MDTERSEFGWKGETGVGGGVVKNKNILQSFTSNTSDIIAKFFLQSGG